MSVARLAAQIRAGELSPREAVEFYLERIEAHSDLNAYISVRAEEALSEADSAPPGPLHGVPVAIKDVIDVAGTRTTGASRLLADAPPAPRDAATVAGLKAAGAIVLGKLNLHEFAFGAMTNSAHFGPARNPWDPARTCGGSSGGSGCAAAADLCAGNLGTDTGGSIRIPSALCGVTGLRPTIGLVPNDGLFPVSWTFDTIGPLGRSAEDCELLLQAIAPSYRPSTEERAGGGPARAGRHGDSPRVGIVTHLLQKADPAVGSAVEAAARELAAEPVDAQVLDHASVIQQLIMLPEAAAAHLPWLRSKLADYGADVRVRLLAGLSLPITAYPTGLRARRWLWDQVRPLFERYDILVAPTMPMVAPRLDAIPAEYRLELMPFNSPWSCLGLPAASVPCGFVDGLPVGMVLVGRRGEDATVLQAARRFQEATDWHERRPDLVAAAPSA